MVESIEYFQVPSNCPICSNPLDIEGDFLYCRSSECSSRLYGDLKVWIDRLGLLFWGDALIESLTDPDNQYSIKSVVDIYKMSVEDLEVHCSGRKMAEKCWRVLHNNMEVPLEVILSGLNIPNLGLVTATDIVKSGFDTIEKIGCITLQQLVDIPNIGTVTANQIRSGLDVKGALLADLGSVLSVKSPSTGPLAGKKVCITGDVWAPRKAVQKMIISAGGTAVNSVSKDTSILVCDNIDSSSAKSKRANEYGIPVISGNDLKMVLDGKISLEGLFDK